MNGEIYVNTFPAGCRVEWAAADTETLTFIDGVALSEAEIKALGGTRKTSWFRKHTTVRAYAWIISDGVHLAIFPDFEQFAAFCAEKMVSVVWWYNAKFDFANIDYEILKSGWKMQERGKLGHCCFRSLHSEFGARYQYAIAYNHKGRNGSEAAHMTKHLDFCNIFGGGLAKILESFDVRDYEGNTIRKLTADYQEGASVEYMANDAHGLFHAVRIASDFLFANFGLRLAGDKPDAITAGGLAKKLLLRTIYKHDHDDAERTRHYRTSHGIFKENDRWYRKRGIYRGAITFLNPRYANRVITRPMYRYDVNSMYPSIMAEMPDIKSAPRRITWTEYEKRRGRPGFLYVIEFSSIRGEMRPGMLPLWYDNTAPVPEYTEHVDFSTENNGGFPLLMFDMEWDELQNYYDFGFEPACVYEYKVAEEPGYSEFVAMAYAMKREGKKNGDKVKEAFAKLLLNSSYGKLAENATRRDTFRVLDAETDTVKMKTGKTKTTEERLLSVLQGAYITAGARVKLMRYIREICPVPARDFIYCDTDSVHAFTLYDGCDPYRLGAMKNECDGAPFNFIKYLAPKTYFDAHVEGGAVVDIEIHSKGIATKNIKDELKGKTPEEIAARFAVGEKFQSLSGMNVPGGKALIPLSKFLCKEDNGIVERDGDGAEINLEKE